jgi:hypothetical protein
MEEDPAQQLTRGQIVEAIQNVLLDYETTEQSWLDNKQALLDQISQSVKGGGEEAGGGEASAAMNTMQSARLVQKREREEQWKGLLEHWEGVEGDFHDLDKNFEMLGEVLDKARQYWRDTTLKTTEALIARNDEIAKQGDEMKAVEARASKIRTKQDEMNAMMNSKAVCMGRIVCPIMMFMCCLLLTVTLITSVVARSNPAVVAGAANQTR